MKIVVLDGYTENPGDLSWSALEQLGELVVYDRTSYEESDLVAERIGDADVAILNKTPISKATMDQCPNLKLIAVLATGYNVVDVVSTEPIQADNPLLKAKNCIITPHMSWGSRSSRQRIMDCTVENVRAFLAGQPQNVVNK